LTQSFTIPYHAWYGDDDLTLTFPDSWKIHYCPPSDAPELSDSEIKHALSSPIETPPISDLAKGKNNAVIVVEDISRPINWRSVLNLIIKELEKANITKDKITLILALGAHRPMNRNDCLKKLGPEIVNEINIENHHPYENLVFLGKSSQGTPIHINKTYYNADLKIACGTVVPHPLAGFGGGAKIILPGISGIETLAANHKAVERGVGVGIGIVTGVRKDIEEIGEKVGLDFSINAVSTMNRKIAGLFCGHFISAHRKAMELAKQTYSTKIPGIIDIGIFNMYPEDLELNQSQFKAFNFLLGLKKKMLKRKGSIVVTSACTEGRGYHSLMAETGAKLYKNLEENLMWKAVYKRNQILYYSENINRFDVLHFFPKNTFFSKEWDKIIDKLTEIHGDSPIAAIIPSSIQLSGI